jgi:YHS domain-containing protein
MRLRDGTVTLGVRPERMLAKVDVQAAVEDSGLRLESLTPPGADAEVGAPAGGDRVVDPVCHMHVGLADAAWRHEHAGTSYGFCSEYCVQRFRADPERYLK